MASGRILTRGGAPVSQAHLDDVHRRARLREHHPLELIEPTGIYRRTFVRRNTVTGPESAAVQWSAVEWIAAFRETHPPIVVACDDAAHAEIALVTEAVIDAFTARDEARARSLIRTRQVLDAREIKAELAPPIVHQHGCSWGCGSNDRELMLNPVEPAIERQRLVLGGRVIDTRDCCVKCALLARAGDLVLRGREGRHARLAIEPLDPIHHGWIGVLDVELGEHEVPRASRVALSSLLRGDR